MVSLVAEWLLDQGERPAILTRGYGRRDRRDGVVVVSDGRKILVEVDQAGDEPFMLARKLPGAAVLVAEDRFVAGVLAERRLGATVHLLDDGFQHVQLARDVDILMTRPGEITKGRVLPMGRLREPISAAARADIVVVLDGDLATARSEAWTLGVSQVAVGRRALPGATGAVRGTGAAGATGATDSAHVEAVVAVAGIAWPDEFFQMLRSSGYNVVDAIGFADHHRFTASDVQRIDAALKRSGAARVLTNEKDFVRLEQLRLPFACTPVPLTLTLDGWEALASLLTQAMARRRGAAA